MMSWVVPWIILLVERTVNVVCIDVASLDKDVGKLEYVHMMIRHGEMSIGKKYKQDPYREEKFWPEGMGLLTSQGILNQYHLGQWIGERYSTLLPYRKFNRKLFKLYSGLMEENVLSATTIAQGIFKSGSEILNELKWVPIPVTKDESFQFTDQKCTKHEELTKKFLSSNEYHTLRNKYDDLFSGAANYTGIDDRPIEFKDLIELWNNFVIESNNKLALHDWAKSVYPKTIAEPVALAYILSTWTPDMKRATGGRFFKSLMDVMTNKSNGTERERNMTAISMDDYSMASILDVMGLFDSNPPPFDSIIMIELRKSQENNYAVTILYHNETSTNTEGKPERVVHILKLPSCTEACPLKKFQAILSPFVIDHWGSFCSEGNMSIDDFKNDNSTTATSPTCNKFNWKQIIVQTVIGSLILLLVIIGMCNRRGKKSVVVNDLQLNKTGSIHEDNGGGTESAEMFLTSLGDTPSVFIDPMYGAPPFEIFTLPPPFIPPPDMVMFSGFSTAG